MIGKRWVRNNLRVISRGSVLEKIGLCEARGDYVPF
jgi:hypothetical protein